MQLSFTAATDVGKQRDHNEDSYLVEPNLRLFIVADGMGGHAAGEVASRMAVSAIKEFVDANKQVLTSYAHKQCSSQAVLELLSDAVLFACQEIHQSSRINKEQSGMGTTTSAMLIAGPEEEPTAFIAHVGDSRIYLCRGNHTHQVTEDHAVKHELIRKGKVSRDRFATSPYAQFENSVTRALGAYPTAKVDTLSFAVASGDHFLLCTDGLFSYFEKDQMNEYLNTRDNSQLPDTLIAVANNGGGHDNITCISVLVGENNTESFDLADADVVAALEDTMLGQVMSSTQRWQLLGLSRVQQNTSGEALFAEDDEASCAYFILSGEVTLESKHKVTVGPGQWFGLDAIFGEPKRTTDATAKSDVKLLRLEATELLAVSEASPPFGLRVLWSMGKSQQGPT